MRFTYFACSVVPFERRKYWQLSFPYSIYDLIAGFILLLILKLQDKKSKQQLQGNIIFIQIWRLKAKRPSIISIKTIWLINHKNLNQFQLRNTNFKFHTKRITISHSPLFIYTFKMNANFAFLPNIKKLR